MTTYNNDAGAILALVNHRVWQSARSAEDWDDIGLYFSGAIIAVTDAALSCEYLDDYETLIHIANQHALDAEIHSTTHFGSLERLANIATEIDTYKFAIKGDDNEILARMVNDLHELVARQAGERVGEIYSDDDMP
jgi:hypothetical protein